jgi:hypothetical protein
MIKQAHIWIQLMWKARWRYTMLQLCSAGYWMSQTRVVYDTQPSRRFTLPQDDQHETC